MSGAATSSTHRGCASPEAAAAIDLLRQCRELLAGLPSPIYSQPSRVLPGGTIGKHLRHLLDHYFALLGVNVPGGVIDYDHRDRDVAMESNVLVALGMLDRAARQLAGVDAETLRTPVRVRCLLSADGLESEHASTIGRELAFATHHGIHHAAMMGGIGRELGLDIAPDFGKAPSTLVFEGSSRGGSLERSSVSQLSLQA